MWLSRKIGWGYGRENVLESLVAPNNYVQLTFYADFCKRDYLPAGPGEC